MACRKAGFSFEVQVEDRIEEDEMRGALLLGGVLAGPVYFVTSLVEAFARDGFDPGRHAWSLLANGESGWVHVTNLVVSGLLVIAGAAGLRTSSPLTKTAVTSGPVMSPAASVLLGIYGASLVAAGLFRADPVPGFPAGTTETEVSWHGMLHFVAGGIGFACLVVACLVIGGRDPDRGWAWLSRGTGITFGLGFLALAGSGGRSWAIIGFTAVVVLASGWLSAMSVRALGRTGNGKETP